MSKKIISLLMVLCMVCALFPAQALAEEAHIHEYKPIFRLGADTHLSMCSSCRTSVTEPCTFKAATVKEATCTEKGEVKYVCDCGNSYTEETEVADHEYESAVTKEPTCVEKGVKTFTCQNCGYSYTEEIPVLAEGHRYVDTVVAPTCTEKGYTSHTCSLCGSTHNDTYVEAQGHDCTWAPAANNQHIGFCRTCRVTLTEDCEIAEEVVKEATCTEAGQVRYTCSVCKRRETKDTEVADHEYEGVVTKKPTCAEKGIKTFTCKNCGDSYEEEIEELPHTLTGWMAISRTKHINACLKCTYSVEEDCAFEEETVKEATCTQKGEVKYVCVCGNSHTEETDVLDHEYEGVVTKEPTCAEKGIKTFTCKGCGDSYEEEIDELDHTLTDWMATSRTEHIRSCLKCTYSETEDCPFEEVVVVKEPTCSEKGTKKYICVCGNNYEVEIDELGHEYEGAVTKEPTCSEKGIMTYTCACGDNYTEEIEMLEHSYVSEVTKKPTCVDDGVETFTCVNCNHSYHVAISAENHNYEDTVVPPTCTEQGYTKHTCSLCGDTYNDTYVAVGDHIWVAQTWFWQPTCTRSGAGYFVCESCGKREFKFVDALGHNWDNGTVLRHPSCTQVGVKTYTCYNCGSTRNETMPALDHSYVNGICTGCGRREGNSYVPSWWYWWLW